MASLDEGVANLERFCGLLTQTNDGLKDQSSALEARADEVADLEDGAQEALGDLGDALQDVQDAVKDDGAEAADAVDELAEMAGTVAGDRLGEVRGQMDETESSFERRLDEDSAALEGDFAELISAGFEPLSAGVETAEGGARASGQAADESFDALESGLQGLQQDVDSAAAEAVSGLGEAAGGLSGDVASGLESAGSESAAAWTGELPSEMESGCSAAEGPAMGAYGEFSSEGLASGDALIETVSSAGGETASFLLDEQAGHLEQAGETAIGQCLPELQGETDNVKATAEAGAETATALEPMVGELELSKSVVAEVDQLLAAIGG